MTSTTHIKICVYCKYKCNVEYEFSKFDNCESGGSDSPALG